MGGSTKRGMGLGVTRGMGLGVTRGMGLGVARAAMDAAAPAPRCATPPEAEVKASFPARASAQRASAASSRVELIICGNISAKIATGKDDLLGVAIRLRARLLDGVAQGGNGEHAATGRDG